MVSLTKAQVKEDLATIFNKKIMLKKVPSVIFPLGNIAKGNINLVQFCLVSCLDLGDMGLEAPHEFWD